MALRRKRHSQQLNKKRAVEHHGLYPYLERYQTYHQERGAAESTLKRRDSAIRRFIAWCDERGLEEPQSITKPILERYQRYLYHYRKSNGEPLSFSSQNVFLSPLKSFFKWLTQQNYLLYNPASELQLPKKPKRLPRAILSHEDMHQILKQPDTHTLSGIRDRTLLALLYSTGLRRSEVVRLTVDCLDFQRHTISVREGKYQQDRYVPLSDTLHIWLQRYLYEVRPQLLIDHNDTTLFLTDYGEAFSGGELGHKVKRYLQQAGITATGSCHLFRHAMATHMLENGADIRYIQQLLGHRDLSTTEIYTQVSMEQLRKIHQATHPETEHDIRQKNMELNPTEPNPNPKTNPTSET